MKKCCFLIAWLILHLHALAVEGDSLIHVTYRWDCLGKERQCSLDVSQRLYDYYRNQRKHLAYYYEDSGYGSAESYCGFMFSEYSRDVIKSLAEQLMVSALSHKEKIMAALSFVQSLKYVLDEESKAQEEYVRYPVETLVDGEGDCEDKTALLAALLKEMGEDFVIIILPDHLALGVQCDAADHTNPIKYDGKTYYYVESTTPKWAIGQIPSEYASSSFEVAHWISSPVLVLKKSWFESRSYSVWSEATCKVILQMFNLGPGRSTGIKAHWEILERKRRKWKLLAQGDSYLDDMQEGEERIDTIPFQGVIGDKSRLRVVLSSNASRDQIVEIDLYSKSR